jgi:hypothetical protein
MFPHALRRIGVTLTAFAALAAGPLADPTVPASLLDPRTAAEAWNVIRLATANVDRLIAEKRLREIPVQVSFCSPALRALGRAPELVESGEVITRAIGWVGAVGASGVANDELNIAEKREKLRMHLAELAAKFDPATVNTEIHVCPQHPDFLAGDPATPCLRCGAKLNPRRVPYRFVYVKPGAPTIRLTGAADAPLAAGRPATVKFQLAHLDGSPVQFVDLLSTHSQPIQVFIQERGLNDFQLTFTDPAGNPFTQLEPVMNSFAHLVGFYDDYGTPIHLHPSNGEIFLADARGGPTMLFTCFPPRPGFLRLFCEVQVQGAPVVVAFGVRVEP